MPLFLPNRSRACTVAALLLVFVVLFSLVSLSQGWGDETWHAIRHGSQQAGGQDAPSPVETKIPKKLWYKLGPSGLSKDGRKWTSSCIDLNPDYKVEFLTDSSADRWVQTTFGESHPDLVSMFLGLTVPIVKADFLRYLLLWAEGGVYNDLDVSCEVPISEWIPADFLNKTTIVAGWEFDYGWGDHILRQFATWTIMSVPRSPHIWTVIEDIMEHIRKVIQETGVPIGELTREHIGNIITATGPKRFTRGLMKSLGEKYHVKQEEVENLLEPKMLGDVLVLPGFSFAKSSNKYGDKELPRSFVKHHYAGTWKNAEGGEKEDPK